VIDMDSAVYRAVQSGIAAGTLPNLATEDKPVRDAAELVANRRLAITGASRSMEVTA
jgi:hypothetical protein